MSAKKMFSLPVAVILMIAGLTAVMIGRKVAWENRFAPIIKVSSVKWGLDPFLVKAVIRRESGFRPGAKGSHGEAGLMQVTPDVGREYVRRHKSARPIPEALFDPAFNIEVGCWYLSRGMKRYGSFRDPVPYALAYYNAGASNVDRWIPGGDRRGSARAFLRSITYPGTRDYVQSIMRRRTLYRIFSL